MTGSRVGFVETGVRTRPRRRFFSLACALCLLLAWSVIHAPDSAGAPGSVYAAFAFAGTSGHYTGSMTLTPGFPTASFTSTSRSGSVGVQTGVSTWLPAGSPPGGIFGSSQGQAYLNLRPAADNAGGSSVTTYTFDGPTPPTGWGFVLGDIDADQVRITATTADGTAVATSGLGFAGTFNYCDATPRSAGCAGQSAPFDQPTWDGAGATLTGNAAATDTVGASGWFRPTVALKTLTFTYTWRSGFPVYQTWFATVTRAVSGSVTSDGGAGLGGRTVEILDGGGSVVGTAVTGPDGSYSVDGLAPGIYSARVDTPPGFAAVGPEQRTVDLLTGDRSGVDFLFAAAADLSISKVVDTSPVVAGQTIQYSLTVTNSGPAAATGVVVTDTMPAGLTGLAGQITGGPACSVSGSALTCPIGALADGASAAGLVTGQVPSGATDGSILDNAADVTGDQVDPAPGDNESVVSSTVDTSADLSINKTFSPASPVAGGQVVYQLAASNSGPSQATGVNITDPLDPAVTFVSATIPGGTCAQADHVVSCDVATVDPGSSVSATIAVTLPSGSSAVQNVASVSASTKDPAPANNVDGVAFGSPAGSNLSLTKSVTPTTATPGQTVGFTLTVSNTGSSDVPSVVLSDSIPDGLTAVTVTDAGGSTCTIADTVTCVWTSVPAQQSRVVKVSAEVDPSAPDGALTNAASVIAPIDELDTTDNSATATVSVMSAADLSISKSVTPGHPVPGRKVTFALVTANAGPQRAQKVELNDPLPVGLSGVTVDDPSDCVVDDVTVRCLFDGISSGDSHTVTVTAELAADYSGTDLSNTATVVSLLTADPQPDNNSASVAVPVAPSADVSLTKKVSPATASPGDPVTYVEKIFNAGPSVARSAELRDTVPTAVRHPSTVSPTGTCAVFGQVVDCDLGDLGVGASVTVTITGTAAIVAAGPVTNSATVSSGTPDPLDNNNTAEATFTALLPMSSTSAVSGPPTTAITTPSTMSPNPTASTTSTGGTPGSTTTAATTPTTATSADEGALADTGTPIRLEVMLTLTLLVFGGGLLLVSRRRAPRDPQPRKN